MMEITRNFNGLSLTINLTASELREAFEYQQQLYDEADVQEVLDNLIDEGTEYPDEYLEDMKTFADFLDDAVSKYRDAYTCDQPEYDQREEAVMTTLRKFYSYWESGIKEES